MFWLQQDTAFFIWKGFSRLINNFSSSVFCFVLFCSIRSTIKVFGSHVESTFGCPFVANVIGLVYNRGDGCRWDDEILAKHQVNRFNRLDKINNTGQRTINICNNTDTRSRWNFNNFSDSGHRTVQRATPINATVSIVILECFANFTPHRWWQEGKTSIICQRHFAASKFLQIMKNNHYKVNFYQSFFWFG